MRVYFLVDTSGSTVRAAVNAGWNRALPRIMSLIEELPGDPARVCILSYGSAAAVRLPLTPARDVAMIPAMVPAGLSSLAAGLRLLADTVQHDDLQLLADGVAAERPTVVLVADGLPTDAGEQVVDALHALDAAVPGGVDLTVLVPADADALAIAAMRASRHALATGDPERVADSIESAVRARLG